MVSDYDQVNHNYEREHALNLWFVVTAADRAAVTRCLDEIEARSGLALVLDSAAGAGLSRRPRLSPLREWRGHEPCFGQAVARGLEPGLAMEPRPMSGWRRTLGVDRGRRPGRLDGLQDERDAIKPLRRRGATSRTRLPRQRHGGLGCAGCGGSSAAGRILADLPFVTLCYRRPRRPPRWPYNLFCMIHGRDRAASGRSDKPPTQRRAGGSRRLPIAICCSPAAGSSSAVPATVPPSSGSGGLMTGKTRCARPASSSTSLQGGFPLVPRPFAAGRRRDLGLEEAEVISAHRGLLERGVLSRFGPLYDAESAWAVRSRWRPWRCPRSASRRWRAWSTAIPEVAHNYRREHASTCGS